MRYLPHTSDEIADMLHVIGVKSVDDLFACIPEGLKLQEPLDLPPALPELQLRKHLRRLSRENAHGDEWISFLGAGAYRHYVPSAVRLLLARSEFSTAYTPYQPEVSQGTLQALFEFQTMVAEMLGHEIANASHYDGASATAEALLMALRLTKRNKILIAHSVPHEYRQVIQSYLQYTDVELVEIPYDPKSGRIKSDELKNALDDQVAAFLIAYPNVFGVLENFSEMAGQVHDCGGLMISCTPEPWSLALAEAPGVLGADIATAEGHSFGNAMNYGGPSLGLFATHKKYARQMPGRLVGETTDSKGQRGYVLTLATREQHIRRERATSNICTNVSLCALAATITLSLIGKQGFRKMATENLRKSEQAKNLLAQIPGVSLAFNGITFNEFVIRVPKDPEELLKGLEQEKILGGVALRRWYPELENHILINVTDMNTDEEIATFARQIGNLLAD